MVLNVGSYQHRLNLSQVSSPPCFTPRKKLHRGSGIRSACMRVSDIHREKFIEAFLSSLSGVLDDTGKHKSPTLNRFTNAWLGVNEKKLFRHSSSSVCSSIGRAESPASSSSIVGRLPRRFSGRDSVSWYADTPMG